MNNVSKKKIAAGYVVLLAVLLYSLFFVHREMENLMSSDNSDILRTDSLIGLLREKDANTVRLLRTLSEANDSMISAREVEQIIAEQDTIITQQRVQRRVTARRDTVVTQPKKKGFFRRLGKFSFHHAKILLFRYKLPLKLLRILCLMLIILLIHCTRNCVPLPSKKKATNSVIQRRKRTLQRLDHALSARIDSLLKGYEQETLLRAREEAEYQKAVRHRSATIISGIAAGAVVLSVIFLVMIWRDVTRSNRYRRQLEEANRFAEELLASREKLMLAITHDFKAPLGSIMGYADLLSRLTVDGRQRFYLDNMKTSSEHLLKLVTDLLDFHRLDLHKAEINRVTFHPARLLEEIYVSFEPLTSAKGLSLKCEIDPELKGTFISDPLRLRQIVNNLLSNAVKFTSEGGITLTASFVPKGDSVFSGNHLKLSVIDTGKGMEPGDRERIFQEFTRLPGAQGEEGFGLGLSIVRMLVQLLEGRIEVDSVLGKGSTFTLRVPLYPVALNDTSEVNEQNNANSSSLPAQTPALHILLIDDDRIQLTLTSAMLAQSGITSVSCLQLDELLEALRTDTFDVLLTDVQMPAMNGFDLLNLLRASNIPQAKTIPVIAVTARSDMQREEFLKHGFAGSLHKPFMVNELFAELDIEKRETGLVTPQNHVEMDAVQTDRIATEAVPVSALNFSALTAFSGDDPDAAKSILESFVTETRLNADRLRQALDAEDTDGIAAMGHKMLPLFTLLGADELVALLKELEDSRGQVFSEKIKEKSFSVLALIEDVVAQVEE